MNTIFNNNNKQNKDGPSEKDNCLGISEPAENVTDEEKFLKKAFVAWPENKTSPNIENGSVEIIERRTKNGGYVAYPKGSLTDKNDSLDVE